MPDEDPKILECAAEFAAEFKINPIEPTLSRIAEKTGSSRNLIKQRLDEAQRKGYLQLILRLPTNDRIVEKLKSKYRCLKEVIVVGHLPGSSQDFFWDKQESIRPLLAREVVRFVSDFARRAKEADRTLKLLKIGIDGGNTLYTAFHDTGIAEVPRIKYEILPLVLGPLVGSKYTASNVATLLASRLSVDIVDVEIVDGFRVTPDWLRPHQSARRLSLSIELPGQDRVRDLDLFLVAIGSKNAGLAQREVNLLRLKAKDRLRHHGDICNLGFDENGIEVPMNRDRAILVTLDTLKKASSNKAQTVVGVGGGQDKWEAIRTALLNSFMSVLITDAQTAARLAE